ncbi:MAG: hypothetical protein KOO65_02755 [Desulfobacterales bacterium]|nr:hypothetical protein [Desulfobacterales bacterium]
MDAVFFRCSSDSSEKRGIVFNFLKIYNSPVNVQKQLKKILKQKKSKKVRLLDSGQGFISFFIITSSQDVKINCPSTTI